MIGTTLSHFRILANLGEGGMGVVYRAEDEKLRRPVALKVLPPDLVANEERRLRFLREARAAAAVTHPNIATIYEVGEAPDPTGHGPGIVFIAMELVEGKTLRELIGGRALPLKEAVRLACEVAEGLAQAHQAQVVHRDLKPDNVVVTAAGHPKILDFGLAKLLQEPGEERQADLSRLATISGEMTREGKIFGTAAYMSPEQARGRAVDARSDLFSFGTMLYEMVTGTAPFQGPTATDVMSAVIRDQPAPASQSNPSVSPDLERIIGKSLEKEADLRYQTARDLVADLKRLLRESAEDSSTTARAGREQASIVVLPFENLSPDPNNAFFADGLTEELIADLAKVRALRVISRTSAMHYKGTTKPVPAIARELNVTHVLEGSVRRAANSLRITAQLIDATTDVHLWAEKYSGGLEDVFDLQEKLSRRIVNALKVELAPDEEKRLAARPTRDPRAYDVWLRAKHQGRLFTREGVEGAIDLVNQAIVVVGENALFHAALAYLNWGAYDAGFGHGEETLARIETHAKKSLVLDPNLAQALLAMGLARYKHGDLQGLVRYAKRAIEIERDSEALAILGFVCADAGRPQEARLYADDAMARDPFSSLACAARTFVDLVDGASDAAFTRCRDWVDRLMPGEPFMLWWAGNAAMHAGREDEARAAFGRAIEVGAGFWPAMSHLGNSALAGDQAAVRRLLDTTTLSQVAMTDEYYPCFLASCLAHVGETKSALDWIQQAISWGFANHHFLLAHNRFFAPLRDDPRFQALVATAREKERVFEV